MRQRNCLLISRHKNHRSRRRVAKSESGERGRSTIALGGLAIDGKGSRGRWTNPIFGARFRRIVEAGLETHLASELVIFVCKGLGHMNIYYDRGGGGEGRQGKDCREGESHFDFRSDGEDKVLPDKRCGRAGLKVRLF